MKSSFLRDLPIRNKLRAIILIISATALLGAFTVFLIYQWITTRGVHVAQIQVMAEIMADQSTAALEFNQKQQAGTLLSSLKAERQIVEAAIYDGQGRPFAQFLRDGGERKEIPERPRGDGVTFEKGELLLFHPIRSAGERIGTLFLHSDMSLVWERLWVNLGTAFLVLLGASLAVLLLSTGLGRLITGPVLRLAEVVQAVSARRDYSVRAEPHGTDEIGRLIEGFNDMLSQLQTRDQALALAHSELEARVRERTRELQDEVSERKAAEKRLQEKDARLTEAQQIARLGSWEWDLSTNKVVWSDEVYRVHALLPAEFPGTHEEFLKCAHPDDRRSLKEVLETARQRREPFSLDYRIIRRDGEVRSLHAQGKAILDDAGRALRLVGTLQDITERKRADEAIQELNRKLQAGMNDLATANKELEGFSYSVSHDLRAPLRAIDGYSRMLEEDCAPGIDGKGRRYLEVIRGSTMKMAQLIDDLLSFSRMGRVAVEIGEIDMEGLARSVSSELEATNPGRRLEFRLGTLPKARGDQAMIKQVLVNLLSNAVKYSRGRDPAIIEVSSRDEGAESLYTVKDNGVGFEMEYAGKLFGVFQRLHSSKEFEGTGVGLALVQRIIQRHGGRVWGEGKLNQGATFHFSLPRKEAGHGGRFES